MRTDYLPDRGAFEAGLRRGESQLLAMRFIADMETPVSTFLKLNQVGNPCFLLESVQGGETRGRYSILGMEPDLIWRCKNGKAEINRHINDNADVFHPAAEAPLASLKALHKECFMQLPEGFPPMSAGLIGYMGYDMVRQMEGDAVPLAWTGGDPDGGLGTDVAKIIAAIEAAWSPAGVAVLVDLGGAETNSEMAVEMLDDDKRGKVVVCNAPVVEGAVIAATEASGGSSLDVVKRTAEELYS